MYHALACTPEGGNPGERLLILKSGLMGRGGKGEGGHGAQIGRIKSSIRLDKNFLQEEEPFRDWFPE